MTQAPRQDRIDTEHLRDYSRLRRSATDRKLAGVAGGLGRHLNIDPTILRVLFVVLAFFGGAGLLLYAALWAFVPEDGRDEAPIATTAAARNAILAVAAAIAALLVVGDAWGEVGFPWPVAVLALLALFLLMNRDKPVSTTHQPPPVSPGSPEPASQVPPSTGEAEAEYSPPSPWDPYGGAVPPPATPYPVMQPPAPRSERGPKLFWFTVALLAVTLGSLGLYDVAQGGVPDAGYPALALAVIGTVLVVGAWFGRPGGLIALGVVAAVALVGASAGDVHWGDERVVLTPGTAAEVDYHRNFTAGATHLNLSRISDLENLDGRTIDIQGNAGEIVVTLPDDVDVDINATVSGAGDVNVLGEQRSGVGAVSIDRSYDGGDDVPAFDLNLDLVVGNIEVRQ